MKKVLYVIAFALAFVACDDDDNNIVVDGPKVVDLSADTLTTSFEINKESYQAVLLNTDHLKTGSNAVVASLVKIVDGKYVEIENPGEYEIGVYPEMNMGTMKHSSPNNADFVWNKTIGVYEGTLNFTMSGKWLVYLTIRQGDTVIADQIYWTLQLK